MRANQIPLIILGGSDRKPVKLPDAGSDQHPLSGYKGVDIHLGGRPLVELAIERALASGWFAPVYVTGPKAVYGPVVGSDALIDANGSFGQNIESSFEAVCSRHPGSVVAFLTCDVLPEVETLQRLRALYESHAPCDLWFPLVPVEREKPVLGASAWKPVYRIVPESGEPATEILPGHLVVTDPQALRLGFIYNLFQIAYATRNRPIVYRRNLMLRQLMLKLLYQDMLHILGLRLPTLTWNVITAGVAAAAGLKQGTIVRSVLEGYLRRLFVKRRHCKQFPQRRIVLPFVDELSLAMDIDTEEEAQRLVTSLSGTGGAPES
jgi:hypothetical protein